MRRLIVPLVFVFVSLPALGDGAPPPVPLNDTGQTKCYDGSALVDCTSANTGDAASYQRQDARFGRDAAAAAGALTKTGGGAAGFDFTPLDAAGVAISLTGTPPVPSATPACVKDNVTGLIWEVKTDDGGLRDKDWTYRWRATAGGASCGDTLTPCHTDNYVTAVNAASLCGASDWRLPTRRELLSIVHLGASSPSIDTDYFPNTVGSWYWSGDLYTPNPAYAWLVVFGNGDTNASSHGYDYRVRLVRGGQ